MSQAGDSSPSRRAGLRRLLAATATAAVVVTGDQVTKSWAVARLASGPLHVAGPLSLALAYNTGVAFSLGRGLPVAVFVVVMIVVVVVLTMLGRRVASVPSAVALGAVLGGAVGNLSDRIFRGHGGAVVDFVRLGFWPTFNVADASLVCGCVALGALTWRHGATGRDRAGASVSRARPAGRSTGR